MKKVILGLAALMLCMAGGSEEDPSKEKSSKYVNKRGSIIAERENQTAFIYPHSYQDFCVPFNKKNIYISRFKAIIKTLAKDEKLHLLHIEYDLQELSQDEISVFQNSIGKDLHIELQLHTQDHSSYEYVPLPLQIHAEQKKLVTPYFIQNFPNHKNTIDIVAELRISNQSASLVGRYVFITGALAFEEEKEVKSFVNHQNRSDSIPVPNRYRSALETAKTYKQMHISKQCLYDQLISEYGEQFSPEAAQYAIDHLEANWKEHALEIAKVYQASMNMSPSAIRKQLTAENGERFTANEADYAIENLPPKPAEKDKHS